jgi:hypothetical protein
LTLCSQHKEDWTCYSINFWILEIWENWSWRNSFT